VGGVEVENFQHVVADIVLDQADYMEVSRNGEKVKLPISVAMRADIISKQPIIAPRIPIVLDEIGKKSPAAKAGLKSGDKVVGVDSLKIKYIDELRDYIQSHRGLPIVVKVDRAGQLLDIPITVGQDALIGISFDTNLENFFNISVKKYGFWASIPAGVNKSYDVIASYLKQLSYSLALIPVLTNRLEALLPLAKYFPELGTG